MASSSASCTMFQWPKLHNFLFVFILCSILWFSYFHLLVNFVTMLFFIYSFDERMQRLRCTRSIANMQLEQRNVLLVLWCIAAYKTPDLVRYSCQGANVRVVMTDFCEEFVSPLALQRYPGNKVSKPAVMDEMLKAAMAILSLARWLIFWFKRGNCSYLWRNLHTSCRWFTHHASVSHSGPIPIVMPAMNQQNVACFCHHWKPAKTASRGGHAKNWSRECEQACGEIGYGRMVQHWRYCYLYCWLLFAEQSKCNADSVCSKKIWTRLDQHVKHWTLRLYINHSSWEIWVMQ